MNCCINIRANFNFYIANTAGDDLLDESSTAFIQRNKIKVFKMIDGVRKEINQGNLDAP